MFYAQFRENDAIFYTAKEWFDIDLQPNFRRVRINTENEVEATEAFRTLTNACFNANPTINWSNVSPLVKEF